MARISTSVLFMHYSKIYILTELSANDVKFISVDRQKLDLSKYVYLWYRKHCGIKAESAVQTPRKLSACNVSAVKMQ